MIRKSITFCGQPATIACDANCEKAWGLNSRPRRADDSFVPDPELGTAPVDPGTTEGGHPKPRTPEERLNKWCARECERCWLSPPGEWGSEPDLPDLGG